MAGKLLIVVDTSYWVELFKIPQRFSEEKHSIIKQKFAWAIEQKATLYFPLPCVYELANHIAHVRDGTARRNLAEQLYQTVTNIPSIRVTPACAVNELSEFIQRFKDKYVTQGISLADAAVIDAAKHLKNQNNQVYIWTLETAIKAREPDRELHPFTD
jgi:predicted nucleic acid-binding protein